MPPRNPADMPKGSVLGHLTTFTWVNPKLPYSKYYNNSSRPVFVCVIKQLLRYGC